MVDVHGVGEGRDEVGPVWGGKEAVDPALGGA